MDEKKLKNICINLEQTLKNQFKIQAVHTENEHYYTDNNKAKHGPTISFISKGLLNKDTTITFLKKKNRYCPIPLPLYEAIPDMQKASNLGTKVHEIIENILNKFDKSITINEQLHIYDDLINSNLKTYENEKEIVNCLNGFNGFIYEYLLDWHLLGTEISVKYMFEYKQQSIETYGQIDAVFFRIYNGSIYLTIVDWKTSRVIDGVRGANIKNMNLLGLYIKQDVDLNDDLSPQNSYQTMSTQLLLYQHALSQMISAALKKDILNSVFFVNIIANIKKHNNTKKNHNAQFYVACNTMPILSHTLKNYDTVLNNYKEHKEKEELLKRIVKYKMGLSLHLAEEAIFFFAAY